MYTLAVTLHLIVCFLMIASILLQAGKGAEIGASFGGSSQTVFGSRGPGTFLSKVTVGAAILFMLTSLGLGILSRQATTSSTVIDLHPTTHQESSTTTEQPASVAPATTTSETTDTPTPPSETSSEEATPEATTPAPN